jgi:hypothetical protein
MALKICRGVKNVTVVFRADKTKPLAPTLAKPATRLQARTAVVVRDAAHAPGVVSGS